ncbi:MAG: HD domain-containing phosphohydrolase [Chloroflexota bacterium]
MNEILLVEDEPAHADLVRRAFESRGDSFLLTVAGTVREAHEKIQAASFALIITDWRLPDGEGTELIAFGVPTVVMTSHGNERIAVDAIKAGALDYLVKSDTALLDMPHIAERALREWENVVERKRVEVELHQRVSELEAVSRVSTALRSAETLEDMITRLMDETLAILNTSHGALWVFQSAAGVLKKGIGRGLLAQGFPGVFQPHEGVVGETFTTGNPIRIADFTRLSPDDPEPLLPGLSGISVPIRTAQEIVGVLVIGTELPRQVTDKERNLLATLADIAGNAVHRTQLHEQTQQSLQRLSALRVIDLAITSSVDLGLSLNILVEQARLHLNVDAVSVLILNAYGQTLEYRAGRGFESAFASKTRLRLGEGYPGISALERRPIFAPDLSVNGLATGRAELSTAELFRAYYVMPLITKGHVKGVIEVFHRSPLQPEPDWINFLEALAGQAAIAIENSELFESLQRSNSELIMAYDATIEGWSRALDLRDHETEGHTQRVTEITMMLARSMGYPEEGLIHIQRGALLHDIGKMGVPDNILLKPGPLNEAEWKAMRQHPLYAFQMLSPIHYLRPALDIPYCHHEKWDGGGYPRGLKGDDIPMAARMFAVVDVWDALRSDRPYRAAWKDGQVRAYILGKTGSHFDEKVVKAFMQLVE